MARSKAVSLSTDLSIKNLALPSSGRKEYTVKNAPGLMLRSSSRGKTWYLKARPPGEEHPSAIKIGPYGEGGQAFTLKLAKAKAEQWREDIRGGIDPRSEGKLAKISTFGVLVNEFLERGKTAKGEPWKPDTAKGYRSALKSSRYRKWANLPVAKLTVTQVQDAINQLEDEGKYTTARRHLAYLRAFFGWCRRRKQGYIPMSQALPTDGVEPEQTREQIRDRFLSRDEIRIFWFATEKLEYPWRHYYQLLLLTGQRASSVAGLKRSEVRGSEWEQSDNKSGRPVLIPLNDLALEVLEDCPRTSDFYLTTSTTGPIHKSSKAKRRIDRGISALLSEIQPDGVFEKSWVNHDLRRTMTTQLRQLRVPQVVCSMLLNHAAQGVTGKHYDMYDLRAEKAEAMRIWNNFICELVYGKPANVTRLVQES